MEPFLERNGKRRIRRTRRRGWPCRNGAVSRKKRKALADAHAAGAGLVAAMEPFLERNGKVQPDDHADHAGHAAMEPFLERNGKWW